MLFGITAMKDRDKTKKELLEEVTRLRRCMSEMEKSQKTRFHYESYEEFEYCC